MYIGLSQSLNYGPPRESKRMVTARKSCDLVTCRRNFDVVESNLYGDADGNSEILSTPAHNLSMLRPEFERYKILGLPYSLDNK